MLRQNAEAILPVSWQDTQKLPHPYSHIPYFARDLWAGRTRPDEFNYTSYIEFFKLMMKGSELLVRCFFAKRVSTSELCPRNIYLVN
jgi:hypothetical protein